MQQLQPSPVYIRRQHMYIPAASLPSTGVARTAQYRPVCLPHVVTYRSPHTGHSKRRNQWSTSTRYRPDRDPGTAQSPAQTSGLPTPPPVTDPTLVTVASATPTNQTATGPTPFQVPDAVPAPAVDARSDGLHHLAEAAAGSGVTGVTAAGDNMGVRDQGLQLEPAGAGDVVKVLEEPESHPILDSKAELQEVLAAEAPLPHDSLSTPSPPLHKIGAIPKLAAEAASAVGAKTVGKLAAAAGSIIAATAAKAIGTDTAADTISALGPVKASTLMSSLGPEHAAHLAEKLGPSRIGHLAERVGPEVMSQLVTSLGVDDTAALFQNMDVETVGKTVKRLGPKGAADLLQQLGPVFAGELMLALGPAAAGQLVRAMGPDLASALMKEVGAKFASILVATVGSVATGVMIRVAGAEVVSNVMALLGTDFAAQLLLDNLGVVWTLGPAATVALIWQLGPLYFIRVVLAAAVLFVTGMLESVLAPVMGKKRPVETWRGAAAGPPGAVPVA